MTRLACFYLTLILAACQEIKHPPVSAMKAAKIDMLNPPILLLCSVDKSAASLTVSLSIQFTKTVGRRVYVVDSVKTTSGDERQQYVVGRRGSTLLLASRLYQTTGVLFERNDASARFGELTESPARVIWKIPLPLRPTIPPYSSGEAIPSTIRDSDIGAIDIEVGFLVTSDFSLGSEPIWKTGFELIRVGGKDLPLIEQQQLVKVGCSMGSRSQ